MDKVVWGFLFVASLLLAAFILYLTFTRPDVPLKGFIIAGVILVVSAYPFTKLRAALKAKA